MIGLPYWMFHYNHDDVIKWKHFPRYWPFVRGIPWSPANSPYKGQWRGALMFPLICAWIHGCANNREAGDSRRHCAHYDVTVMKTHWRESHLSAFHSFTDKLRSIDWSPFSSWRRSFVNFFLKTSFLFERMHLRMLYVITWFRAGAKTLSKPIITNITDALYHHHWTNIVGNLQTPAIFYYDTVGN